LLVDKHYPASWVTTFTPIPAGSIVPAVVASNIPQKGDAIRLWIDTPELTDDAYGIGLYDGEYEIVSNPNRAKDLIDEHVRKNPGNRVTLKVRRIPAKSVRRNPALVTFGNPPAGGEKMSEDVVEIRYRHCGDGKFYRHSFKAGLVQLRSRAGANWAVLRRVDGKPLIGDY
jgi:hypothetical protein